MLYQHFVCLGTSKQAGPPTIILANAKILVVQGAVCPSRKPKAPCVLKWSFTWTFPEHQEATVK